MLIFIVKMVFPDTWDGLLDIKTKLETMKMYNFNQDVPKSNLQIT